MWETELKENVEDWCDDCRSLKAVTIGSEVLIITSFTRTSSLGMLIAAKAFLML